MKMYAVHDEQYKRFKPPITIIHDNHAEKLKTL